MRSGSFSSIEECFSKRRNEKNKKDELGFGFETNRIVSFFCCVVLFVLHWVGIFPNFFEGRLGKSFFWVLLRKRFSNNC